MEYSNPNHRPAKLYKYQPFDTQTLENLKSQVIYFGSPLRFNDPYDCALAPRVKHPSDTEVELARVRYLARTDLCQETRAQLERSHRDSLRATLIKSATCAIQDHIDKFLKTSGVSCFSERNDNLLMWSHYAQHGKGFCLEFSGQHEVFNGIRPVKYRDAIPEVDLKTILLEENYDAVLDDLFFSKSSDWKYEREWRAIHNSVGTAYVYPAEVLTGVYFGSEMPQVASEIIALTLMGQNENVTFWRGHRSQARYGIDFEKVTYVSYLEAKRQGLIP